MNAFCKNAGKLGVPKLKNPTAVEPIRQRVKQWKLDAAIHG